MAVVAIAGDDGIALRDRRAEQMELGRLDPKLQSKVDAVRAEYDAQLDARYAAARGFVDAVIAPEDTRAVLSLALRTGLHNAGPHLGPFGALPEGV